jgi:hypothetical protein
MMVKMKNIRKAAFCSLIAVMAIAMITSNQLSTYASPTTEDDGWSEGDYEGGQEEQEEQAQEEWEDAGRPGDNDNDDDDDNDDNNEETQICPDGSVLPVDQECRQPELQICPDGSAVEVDEACSLVAEDPLPVCDGSFQDCITPIGDFCEAGSGAHECEIDEPESSFVTCFDGSSAATLPECPPTPEPVIPNTAFAPGFYVVPETPENDKPLPYCHTPEGKAAKGCHDILDVDQITGKYPCNDGTQKVDYKDCKDATKGNNNDECKKNPFMKVCYENNNKRNDNDKIKIVHKTTVIQGSSATATATANANSADVSNCNLDGSANGIQQMFDTPKYLACGLYADGQKAYSDGFVVGCTQIGNTQLVCQALVDSSILNTKTQPTQMATQPTQTQTGTQPTQAIQPATVGG